MSDPDAPGLEREFRFFAGMCRTRSPLYALLSKRVAEDAAIQALVEEHRHRQPPSNLLFGAVHHLLLGGAQHELAEFYPSVGGSRAPDAAYPVFVDFCRAFEREIRERAAGRRVQTNEVGRCSALLLAIARAWEQLDRRPLYLVELGSSAALNLLFDQYHYVYTDGQGREHACGASSRAQLRTTMHGERTPGFPVTMPSVIGRVGVDLEPVDVMDDDAVRWVEAMIYPDQLARIELFRAAVEVVRSVPPTIIAGDGLEILADAVGGAADGSVPCVFHSRAIYQMSKAWRGQFGEVLDQIGTRRDFAHVSLEWLGDDTGPRLELALYVGGAKTRTSLADCDDHGAWIRWHE